MVFKKIMVGDRHFPTEKAERKHAFQKLHFGEDTKNQYISKQVTNVEFDDNEFFDLALEDFEV